MLPTCFSLLNRQYKHKILSGFTLLPNILMVAIEFIPLLSCVCLIFSFWFSLILLHFYSKVMEVFTTAAEYMDIPVRRSDDEPLQRLFLLVRSELNLDHKNIRQEQAKFWKQHPALVKVICLPFYGCIWQTGTLISTVLTFHLGSHA